MADGEVEQPAILFVDDEQHVLESLKREFRKTPYTLHFALSGPLALEVLRASPVDVIVSDMRMPIMDGVSLLERAQRVDPHIVGVILSAHADLNTVKRAVQSGVVWRFVVKPWESQMLLETVQRAVERHQELASPPAPTSPAP